MKLMFKVTLRSYFLVLALLASVHQAAAQQSGDFSYTSDGSAITITAYTGPGGAVTIPATITGLPVTAIGLYVFELNSNLTSVTIPGSVTRIGDSAFDTCTSLTNVTIPSSVTFIGTGAFDGCTSLWNPLMQTGGPGFGVGPAGFGFTITGTADIPIVIEACTNLANASWVSLQSLNLTNGAFHFSDPNWTNYRARNYRIRSP